MLGNREDAEDAVQETFAKAWARLASFAGQSTFGTWVTSIALRHCTDVERARRSRERHVGNLPRDFEPDRDARNLTAAVPPRLAEQRELLSNLDVALTQLPPRLRTALTLRTIEGLEYEDVAQSMGTSIRSARLYVWEARQRLSRELGLAGDDERAEART
jgi:RNA polymerase sigma-70 factor (ECF subfamily)